MACAISAPSGTHGFKAADTDAPLAVSLDKFKDKANSFEPTNDKAASPNARDADPALLYGYYGYPFPYPYGYGYGIGYGYGRKRSAEAGHLGYGYGLYGKREAVDTKMLQKIKNRGLHGPKSRDLSAKPGYWVYL